jgi:competence protein ComEA
VIDSELPMDNDAPWRALETRVSDPPDAARQPGRVGLIAVVAAAVALVAGSIGLIAFAGMGHGGGVTVSQGSAGPEISAPPQTIVVQVGGAVLHPGVYTLAAGSRVADAIRAAGGYSADVDPRRAETQLNLAAKLTDAESVVVPRLGDASAAGSAASDSAGGLVNLNTATAGQLDALPGIGPATAAKIIASRASQPFTTVDDLVTRKLVTSATLAKFRDQVTV